MSEHLLVFTRYPHVGHVKTRLIPALGAASATQLHCQMVEHTLKHVQALYLRKRNQLQVTILFAGNATIADFNTWLGTDRHYSPQAAGDLGQKMKQGFHQAFEAGAQRVIAIGTDCPGLDAEIMCQAFQVLETADVVLGPALDGGYYLIGVRSPQPLLFENMAWGTSTVLQDTLAILQQEHLTHACLIPLADIDRPEDLPIWDATMAHLHPDHV